MGVDFFNLSVSFILIELSPLVLVKITITLVLLFFSAMLSGAEVALFSLKPSSLESDKNEFDKTKELIQRLLKSPKRLLATILVTINFINIGIVLLFASLTDVFLSGINSSILKLFLEIGFITIIILFFGEILPKIYANRNSLIFSKIVAYPLFYLDKYILWFITKPMSKITVFIENRFGNKSNSFTVGELSKALEYTEQKDTTKQEDKILKGIVSFGNTDTKQVMCPRIDVFALSEKLTLDEILPKIIKAGYSRIPVYGEKIDAILGILYVKDLMPKINISSFSWQKLIREPYYVPENKKLDDLFKEFQIKKIHMAIVVDEYGGTSGIITLEDIIEEIVGDISDEFDDQEFEYTRIDENNLLVDAKMNLKDFYRLIKLDSTEIFEKYKGESETLAGFLLEIVQSFPKVGQKIYFEKYIFKIEYIEQRRIKKIKVTTP